MEAERASGPERAIFSATPGTPHLYIFTPSEHVAQHPTSHQVDKYRATRVRLGIPPEERGECVALEYCAGLEGLTPNQLDALMRKVLSKYEVKRIDPGGCLRPPPPPPPRPPRPAPRPRRRRAR